MKFTFLSIHPGIFESLFKESLLAKAIHAHKIEVSVVNPRDFSDPPHHRVDDKPYGGGPGMVMKPEPIVRALQKIIPENERKKTRVIVLAAKGKSFTQATAEDWKKNYDHLVFICGRYEGIDERVKEFYADEEVRIGDYVLMGGEIAAAVILETVARLVPGVLGNPNSLEVESFGATKNLEYPQYTRPEEFDGHRVPEVLLNGNHAEISKWRQN